MRFNPERFKRRVRNEEESETAQENETTQENETEFSEFGEKNETQEKQTGNGKSRFSKKNQDQEQGEIRIAHDPVKNAQILEFLRKCKICKFVPEPYNLLMFRSDFVTYFISTQECTKEINFYDFASSLDMIVRSFSSNRELMFLPVIPAGPSEKYFRFMKKNFGFCALFPQSSPMQQELPEFESFKYTEKQKQWLKNFETSQPLTFKPFLTDSSDQENKIRIYKFENYYNDSIGENKTQEKPQKKQNMKIGEEGAKLEVKEEFEILETTSVKLVDNWVTDNITDGVFVSVDLEWDCISKHNMYPHLVQMWIEKEGVTKKNQQKPMKQIKCLLFSTSCGEKLPVQLVEKVFLNKNVKKILCGMSEDIRKLQEWWYRHFTPEEYEFYGTYEAVPLLKEFKKFTFIDFDYFERGAAYICERFLGLIMKKNLKARLSDWTQKNLTKEQAFYALEDVAFLYKSYKILSELVQLSDEDHAKVFFLPKLCGCGHDKFLLKQKQEDVSKPVEFEAKFVKILEEMPKTVFEETLVNQHHIHWGMIHQK